MVRPSCLGLLESCCPQDKPEPKEHYPHHDEGTQVETEDNQDCDSSEEQSDEEYSAKNSPDQSPCEESKHLTDSSFFYGFATRQGRQWPMPTKARRATSAPCRRDMLGGKWRGSPQGRFQAHRCIPSDMTSWHAKGR